MPDGTIFPCRRLPIPIGNILKDGVYKIWYGAPLLWKLRNPKFTRASAADVIFFPNVEAVGQSPYPFW